MCQGHALGTEDGGIEICSGEWNRWPLGRRIEGVGHIDGS